MDWPFSDAPNVAVITTREIVEGRTWIAIVSHDADDGGWQFFGPRGAGTEGDARVVSLRSIVEADETIKDLANLSLGWQACREQKADLWIRHFTG